MATKFYRTEPFITLDDFLALATDVDGFTSSHGSRYYVDGIEEDIMYIMRLDKDEYGVWPLDLLKVYEAYDKLEDFSTIRFKSYVPDLPATARGLLLRLGMLE